MRRQANRGRAQNLFKDYPDLGVHDLDAAWRYVEAHREEIEQAIRVNREA